MAIFYFLLKNKGGAQIMAIKLQIQNLFHIPNLNSTEAILIYMLTILKFASYKYDRIAIICLRWNRLHAFWNGSVSPHNEYYTMKLSRKKPRRSRLDVRFSRDIHIHTTLIYRPKCLYYYRFEFRSQLWDANMQPNLLFLSVCIWSHLLRCIFVARNRKER